jgi:catechol 2,3-dioxygenase-like lactoylglutathione lyase family enzyme
MPARGIHHIDLAVADVERSLAFYLDLLGPLGWTERVRYPTYRGTEEVVYLEDSATGAMLGLRSADGGEHRYYEVGIEHLAFEVDASEEVDAAHSRCRSRKARVHFPPEEDRDVDGYYAFFVFDPDGIRVEVFCWSLNAVQRANFHDSYTGT